MGEQGGIDGVELAEFAENRAKNLYQESLQNLEPYVLRELSSTSSKAGGNSKTRWKQEATWHTNDWRSHRARNSQSATRADPGTGVP